MRRLVVVLLLLLATAAACGGDDAPPDDADTGGDAPSDTTEATEAPPDATVLEGEQVEIQAIDNSFVPEAAEITAGTEVTFVNAGRNDHNVVPEDEDAEWGIESDEFHPGDEASYTFEEPGTYRFYCSIHGTIDAGMPGVLVVS